MILYVLLKALQTTYPCFSEAATAAVWALAELHAAPCQGGGPQLWGGGTRLDGRRVHRVKARARSNGWSWAKQTRIWEKKSQFKVDTDICIEMIQNFSCFQDIRLSCTAKTLENVI